MAAVLSSKTILARGSEYSCPSVDQVEFGHVALPMLTSGPYRCQRFCSRAPSAFRCTRSESRACMPSFPKNAIPTLGRFSSFCFCSTSASASLLVRALRLGWGTRATSRHRQQALLCLSPPLFAPSQKPLTLYSSFRAIPHPSPCLCCVVGQSWYRLQKSL